METCQRCGLMHAAGPCPHAEADAARPKHVLEPSNQWNTGSLVRLDELDSDGSAPAAESKPRTVAPPAPATPAALSVPAAKEDPRFRPPPQGGSESLEVDLSAIRAPRISNVIVPVASPAVPAHAPAKAATGGGRQWLIGGLVIAVLAAVGLAIFGSSLWQRTPLPPREETVRLRLDVTPATAKITVDGVFLSGTDLLVTQHTGPYQIRVTAPGFLPEEFLFTAQTDEVRPVRLTLAPPPVRGKRPHPRHDNSAP